LFIAKQSHVLLKFCLSIGTIVVDFHANSLHLFIWVVFSPFKKVVPNIFPFGANFSYFVIVYEKKPKKLEKYVFNFTFFSIVKCGFSSRIHHFREIKKIEEGENIGCHHLATISY